MIFFNIAMTVILWASAYVAIRVGLEAYGPFDLALFRYVTASIVMAAIAKKTGIRIPEKKDLILILLTGFIGITIYNIALNYGELTITASEACFLINTAPLFTTLLSWMFLKENLTFKFLCGLGMGFTGATLIALRFDGSVTFRAGSLIILFAAVAHAAFFVLQRPLLKKYRPIEVTGYAIWSGTLFLIPFGTGFINQISQAGFQATFAAVYLGVFPAALANFCWAYVLNNLPASKAASFLYSVPVVTVAIGYLFLREIPTMLSIIGGAIAISGVIFANSHTEPSRKRIIHSNKSA